MIRHILNASRMHTFVMLLSLTSSIAAFEANIDGLTYNLTGTSATVLHVSSGNKKDTIVVPPTVLYEGLEYTVNAIGTNCFVNYYYSSYWYWYYSKGTKNEGKELKFYTRNNDLSIAAANSYLTYIILPNTIETIGTNAFSNNRLVGVELQTGIKTIDSYAFVASMITSIHLPEGLSSIGDWAFESTKLKEIVIPTTVRKMGNYIFNGCDLLRKITYLGNKPSGWVATTATYVPDETWTNPAASINDAHIIPMLAWNENKYQYTGIAPEPTFTNNMEGYTADITTPVFQKDAGKWSDTISVVFAKENDTIRLKVPYSYTIQKATLNVSSENITREYGEDNPQFKISYLGFVNGETEDVLTQKPSITTTAEKGSDFGTYEIKVSGGESQNYNFVYNNATLTVTKAPLTIKAEDATRGYGSDNPTFTYSYTGLKNEETVPIWIKQPLCVTDAVSNSNVGQYEIRIDEAEATNYDITLQPGILSITKAPLNITVNNASRIYGEPNPQFTFSMEGLKLNEENVWVEEPVISTEADEHSTVGTYSIALQGSIDNPNYEVSVETGTLTIDKRPLTISTKDYSLQYGEELPTFELSFEGFAEGEDVQVLIASPTVEVDNSTTFDAGTYKLRLTGGDATNYYFIDKCGSLTINKAEQQLSWEQEIEEIRKYTQTELTATSTSSLPITYQIVDGKDLANIYTIANKTYLETLGEGEITLTAQQLGNNNYYETPRLFKTISIIGNKKVTLTLKDGEQGELVETLNGGESRTYRIVPSSGYKLHSVTFNDEDVLDQVTSDGTLELSNITANSTLYVVYEQKSTNVKGVASDCSVRILAKQGEILVSGLPAEEAILVYNLDGRIEATAKSNGNTTSIRLASDCTYVVKAGDKTVKVRL